MATYDDIRTQFTNRLNRRDCTTSQRDGFIQSGIQRLQRELRCPAMEKTTDFTITSDFSTTGGLAIPSDLLELIDIIPRAEGQVMRLDKVDITRALRLANESSNIATMEQGVPRVYARDGQVWVIGPAPNLGDVIRVKYYAELAPLVNGTDTNPITLIAPDLIWNAALADAGEWFSDKRQDTWENRYMVLLSQLNVMAETDDENGAAAVQLAYNYPDDLGDIY